MSVDIELVNRQVVLRFASFELNDTLAHAYLFSGPASVGKFETALCTAQLFNCTDKKENFPCSQCSSCRSVLERNNPDLYVIDNGPAESIKIDQIRDLQERIKLRSFAGGKKIFIIRYCENLTAESSNALLKNLEEPSENSLIILTTSNEENILSTVKSRCHLVHFEPLSSRKLEAWLISQKLALQDETHFLAYFTEGCLGKALELKNSNTFQKKNVIIDKFILTDNGQEFLKQVASDKETAAEFLNLLLSWLRDGVLLKSGVCDARLIHLDRLNDLKKFIQRYDFKELNDLYQDAVKTLKMLADNLNVKMPLLIIKEQL